MGNTSLALSGRTVTAVLGPTNTGKTHLAIKRMPAREVYNRIAGKVGIEQVSLVTGEEKNIPPDARYLVCTVEAMPRKTEVAFVALDEVQLADDLERRHIFIDRILHLRGQQETLLLGAATMRSILEKLLPGISVISRPRLSQLSYAGSKEITRLPCRSAIVAFTQTRIFDGFQFRELTPAEFAQIAGRAGRANQPEKEMIERIEVYQFDPVKVLQWRSAAFDFTSIHDLKKSIDTAAPADGLIRALPAVDERALDLLSRDPSVIRLADTARRVSLLWDARALPDYRKITPVQHADIVAAIYKDLVHNGAVDENYVSKQVGHANRTGGDIDTLSHRIARIRTWTFVSNQHGWLADPHHWQKKTQEIENRLSDALHERLTKRFVDRRTSVLMKRLRENMMIDAEISPSGDVLVEGHHVGRLEGFRFSADSTAQSVDAKAVRTAAQKALIPEYEARAERFSACANSDIAIGSDGLVRWIGQPVASLVAGDDILKPRAVVLADEQLTGPAREKIARRIDRFVAYHFETVLKPLFDLLNADALVGMTRGIAFRLVEHFGILVRCDVANDVKGLDQDSRAALRRLGVRFGAYHIFVPALLKPAPAQAITLLWSLKHDARDQPGYGDVVQVLAAGRTSIVVNPDFSTEFYRLAGYRIVGRRAVRVDILERLADLIRPALNWHPGSDPRPDGAYDGRHFIITPAMMSILGATAEDMEEILKNLGYRAQISDTIRVATHLQETADKTADNIKPATSAAKPVKPRFANTPGSATLPEAEPVGVGFAKNAPIIPEEAKPVLLWRYQSNPAARSPKNSHQPRSDGKKRFDKAKQPGHARKCQNVDGPVNDHKTGRQKNSVKNNKQNRPAKSIDPDSPFGKLAALLDQMKK